MPPTFELSLSTPYPGVSQLHALAKKGKRVVGGALAQYGTMRAMRDWRRNTAAGGGFSDDWDEFALDEPILYLQGVEVDEDERGQGIARRLVETIVATGDAAGVGRQWLVVAPMDRHTEFDGLVEFYRSLGFELRGRTDDDSMMIRPSPVRANPAAPRRRASRRPQ